MLGSCCIGQGEATRLCIFAKFRDSRGERTSSMTLLRQLLVMITHDFDLDDNDGDIEETFGDDHACTF